MIAPDVAHDEIVGDALVLARREVRVVAVGAGKLAEGTILNRRNGVAVPHGEGGIDVGRVPHGGPHRAHARQAGRFFRAVDVVFDMQGQPLPRGQRFLQLLRGTETVIDSLRVKARLLPAGDFPPVVGVHRSLGDVGRGDVQKAVLVRAAGAGSSVEGEGAGGGHGQSPSSGTIRL